MIIKLREKYLIQLANKTLQWHAKKHFSTNSKMVWEVVIQ